MPGLHLNVRGRVAAAECRTTTGGKPLVTLDLTDAATGLTVRALHLYPAGNASHYVAHALVAQAKSATEVQIEATNPRIKRGRVECDAAHIHISSPITGARKDLQ